MTFLETYDAKAMEYLLCVFYLLCFVGFWRYVIISPQHT